MAAMLSSGVSRIVAAMSARSFGIAALNVGQVGYLAEHFGDIGMVDGHDFGRFAGGYRLAG
ncbi:hypothetical protein [Paraburkholderia sacchari]|uniref:hypothetical protein n=1 Tax=Paraburkholderia sacchari TaxID=159450 RepID=UPI000541C572|nr:hypothetical protein [Paraburkholderia sacchari]NLP64607.1 hypothetical protein [Paraburkholderia sacchari]